MHSQFSFSRDNNIKIFTAQSLDELTQLAELSPRLRQHYNIHDDFEEPCQRLFNAIEPDSYIRPHRHLIVKRDELLIAIRGLMALVTFENDGQIKCVSRFGTEKYGSSVAAGTEVPAHIWHTVIALRPGSILLEVKAGPFSLKHAKEFASWSPEENTDEARAYFEQLRENI